MLKKIRSKLNFVRIAKFLSIVALLHFLFFVGKSFLEKYSLESFADQSCRLKAQGLRHIPSNNCDTFSHRKAYLYALPYLKYGESISCLPRTSAAAQAMLASENLAPDELQCQSEFWLASSFKRFPDIGWDAYSVWYQRAVALYRFKQDPMWPGTLSAVADPLFIAPFPSPELQSYPWAIPIIYSYLLNIQNSPYPGILQGLNFLMWLMSAWMFWRLWPKVPWFMWILFAAAPIAGVFLFKLYADIWLLGLGLMYLAALEKQRYLAVFLLSVLMSQVKQEGFLLLAIAFVSFQLLFIPSTKREWVSAGVFALLTITGALSYFVWLKSIGASSDAGQAIIPRLFELETFTSRLPKIMGYYLDVFFRPSYWMGLWPLALWLIFKSSARLRWASLPLVVALLGIPIMFIRFDSYKEVVLTGSNRAIWQLFPILFLLTREAYRERFRNAQE